MNELKKLNDFSVVFAKHLKAAKLLKAETHIFFDMIQETKQDLKERDFDSPADYQVFLETCTEVERKIDDVQDAAYAAVDDLQRLIQEINYF